jgi:hypothetical protein
MDRAALGPDYTRRDRRAPLTAGRGLRRLELNRLARFWRPLIDLTPGPEAPIRLRTLPAVSARLARDGDTGWSWFSMIGVPGLRHQVLRHGGLPHYDCRHPADLPDHLRTTNWRVLADAVARFDTLDPRRRALVVFHLAQLSFTGLAVALAGDVRPTGDPEHDRYAYDVARVRARLPGGTGPALAVYRVMAHPEGPVGDPLLALAACFQGIGQSVRGGSGPARAFERRGREVLDALGRPGDADRAPEDWHRCLVAGRFHRAVAVLRRVERDEAGMRVALEAAWRCQRRLEAEPPGEEDVLVAVENRRALLETQLHAAVLAADGGAVRHWGAELLGLDPTCVEARLATGDAYAAIGADAEAAGWYERAGELGTGAGAVGWYRAARCHDAVGDPGAAVHAMARCLELDGSAVEPRQYLVEAAAAGGPQIRPARSA